MKKIISILLTVIMVFSLIAVIIPASAVETGSTNTALKFKSGLENVWRTDKKIDSLPRTFEATIDVPASYYDNYEGQILALYSIYHEGHFIFVDLLRKDAGNNNARGNLGVRLLIKNGVTEATKVYYEALNAHVGQKVHIAITVDTEVRLYINGEQYDANNEKCFYTAAANESEFIDIYNAIDVSKLPFLCLGGDDRLAASDSDLTKFANFRFFKGGIYNACIFGDVRNENEINTDKATLPVQGADNLLVSYDTSELLSNIIPDKSGNGLNLRKGVFYGKEFTSGFENLYSAKKQVTVLPKTIEAYISLPTEYSADQWWGTVIGWSNEEPGTENVVLDVRNPSSNQGEVSNTGVAARFLVKAGNTLETLHFVGSLEAYRGKNVHIAIVVGDTDNNSDTPDTVELYLDGSKFEGQVTGNKENAANLYKQINVSELPMTAIGGDFRAATGSTQWPLTNVDNYRWFRGKIYTVSAFTDIRTANELKADMKTLPVQGADNLLMSYDFFEENAARVVPDKSGNGYNIAATPKWLDAADKTPITGYGYSFAVVGDTQKVTINEINPALGYEGSFDKIYNWIIANKDSKNIQFAFHMGDVTDNDKAAEWDIAMQGISKMDGKIPYNITRGNHDTANSMVSRYTASMYANNVVVGEEYGFFDGRGIDDYTANTLNAYQTITVGDVMYLMISLDMGPCAAVIEWANEVIEAHPYHNVIITTHSYLQGDNNGTTYEGYPYMDAPKDCSATQYNPGGKYGAGGSEGVNYDFRLDSHKNAGEAYLYQDATYMLENLVKKHSNISMVICGHECSEYIKQISATGEAGNSVLQFLVDGQDVDKKLHAAGDGLAGLVAMFYFSEDGSKVTTEYYSTYRDQYLHDTKNTNTYDVNVVSVPAEVTQFYTMMHSLDANDYSEAGWAAITDKLEEVKEVVVSSDDSTERTAAVAALQNVVEEAIDRSELNEAIESAEALTETDYSISDWSDIQNAIETAKEKLAATAQSEVDNAVAALNLVVNGKVKLNRTALNAAIDAAQTKEKDDYTAISWAAFEEALTNARAKLASRDQGEIDAAANALVQATLELVNNNITVEGETTTIIVNGVYEEGDTAEEIVSVDLSWGAMSFTYYDTDEGEWDEEHHVYEGAYDAYWDCEDDANKITITNHSNTDIEAQLSFAKVEGSNIVGSFTEAVGTANDGVAEIATAVDTEPDEAPSVSVYFNIESGSITTSGRLGTITVKIVNK